MITTLDTRKGQRKYSNEIQSILIKDSSFVYKVEVFSLIGFIILHNN